MKLFKELRCSWNWPPENPRRWRAVPRALFFQLVFIPLRWLRTKIHFLHPFVEWIGERYGLPTSSAHRVGDPENPTLVYW